MATVPDSNEFLNKYIDLQEIQGGLILEDLMIDIIKYHHHRTSWSLTQKGRSGENLQTISSEQDSRHQVSKSL